MPACPRKTSQSPWGRPCLRRVPRAMPAIPRQADSRETRGRWERGPPVPTGPGNTPRTQTGWRPRASSPTRDYPAPLDHPGQSTREPIKAGRAGRNQNPRQNHRMTRRTVSGHRVQAHHGYDREPGNRAEQKAVPGAHGGRPGCRNAEGARSKRGRLIAPSTARTTARAATDTVFTGVCWGSSGRSRSTAIAGAARPRPKIRKIDGLVVIPPFITMNGPAMTAGPTNSTPIACHSFARGISWAGRKTNTVSVARGHGKDEPFRTRQVGHDAKSDQHRQPDEFSAPQKLKGRPEPPRPEQQKRALAECVREDVTVEREQVNKDTGQPRARGPEDL